MRLIIASNNAHKVREIKEILSPYFAEILSLREAGVDIDVVEDGDTFEANALKKATEVFDVVMGRTDAVLSDDSGLMVDALCGAPGVRSARFAGEGHNDADNTEKLLKVMEDVPEGERGCRFVSAVALVRQGKAPLIARGSVEGQVLRQPTGDNGFGYDPVFFYEPFGRSFAELTSEEKNGISHRKRALSALKALLEQEQP